MTEWGNLPVWGLFLCFLFQLCSLPVCSWKCPRDFLPELLGTCVPSVSHDISSAHAYVLIDVIWMGEGLACDLAKVRRGNVCLRLGLDSTLEPQSYSQNYLTFLNSCSTE